MIGTIYERLKATLAILVSQGTEPKRLSLRGHPEAIRPLALCFTIERSRAEIEFGERGEIVWLGVIIFEDGSLRTNDQPISDRIFVEIDRERVIVVEADKLPRVDMQCPAHLRPIALAVLQKLRG